METGDEQDSVELPGADALAPGQASALLCKRDARVVAIIGPVNSGKTSLIASVYDLFQTGPIGPVEFSGSRTLHAFERACHDTRSASRRREPTTRRTPLGGVCFYHLEVAGGAARDGLGLLLGDRSGEEYKELAEDVLTASAYCELARADAVTVLVDGERLLDDVTRHDVRSEVVLTLQALHDGDAGAGGWRLALVLTKVDALRASDAGERAEKDFERLDADVRVRFGDWLAGVEAFRVAASPKTKGVRRGLGVDGLLEFWLKPRANVPPGVERVRRVFDRAFARVQPVNDGAE